MKSDWSLVGFTVLAQAAVGTAWGLTAGYLVIARGAGAEVAAAATSWGVAVLPALGAVAIAVSFLHLARPVRAWRAVANLRISWLSREVAAAAAFCTAATATLLAPATWRGPLLATTSLLGGLLIVSMVRTYRMRTVPGWDSWATGAAFLQSALATGGTTTALVLAVRSPHEHARLAVTGAAVVAATALLAGPWLHTRWMATLQRLPGAAHETAARLARERARRRVRWVTALAGALLAVSAPALGSVPRAGGLGAALLLALAAETTSRTLFYRARVRAGL